MDIKECSHCHKFKQLDDFGIRNDRKFGCTSWCKVCLNKRAREKYTNDSIFRDKHDKATRKCNEAKYKERLAWTNSLKISNGCTQCGYNKDATKLLFHHVTDDKVDDISHMLWYSPDNLIDEELAKTIVMCKSCHRQVHNYGIIYLKQLQEGD